jgi:glycosyltransferase involved in cell wall biosynthesis
LRRASARSVTQARRPSAIFSFDDAMYAGHDDVSRLNHPRLYSWKYGSGYDEVIRRSSHVLVGNRILAEYARKLNSNVSVIPTVVDCGKYSVKAVQRDASQPVTIGWMGSHSTAPYLSAIEPALRCLAKVHAGKVRFRFIGDPGYKLDVPQSESVPFQLDHEIEHLHSLDIGLMPLPDTEWTRGKCAFKAIQYMAGGVPVVASPVGVTLDVIQHNVNGLLARSADEWFHALDRLMCDLDLRERVAIAARRTVEEAYSLEVWGPRFVELFDQLGADQGILQPETVAA